MAKIAGNPGGSKNIQAVLAAFSALTALGFNVEQIVKIASHHGGSQNIEAIQKHGQGLLAKGYSKEDLVSIVACCGGSRRIYDIVIVQKNAAEAAAEDDFLHLPSSENNPSQNSVNVSEVNDTFFSQSGGVKKKRLNVSDDSFASHRL